ncbi:MAG TPA: response regulator, partial [Candidatus Cloacimonadota bacterium]|nr:response regulator [Candidatus Cloacimonadota bacterium]
IILLKEEKELIYKGNQETVLIVDDEAVILQIAKDILLESNYQVLCASDGIEALDIYKDKMNDIKLVVLDMLMPKKSGRDTFIELKALNPEVKVLLCSGFKKDERVEEIMSLGINHFIQKPYTLHKLSKMVYDILKGNSSQ